MKHRHASRHGSLSTDNTDVEPEIPSMLAGKIIFPSRELPEESQIVFSFWLWFVLEKIYLAQQPRQLNTEP